MPGRGFGSDLVLARTILARTHDALRFVDPPTTLDALEGGGPKMPILSITVVGLIALRTAEADRTRPEPMGGRVERVAALRAFARREIPQWILAIQAANLRLQVRRWSTSPTGSRVRIDEAILHVVLVVLDDLQVEVLALLQPPFEVLSVEVAPIAAHVVDAFDDLVIEGVFAGARRP